MANLAKAEGYKVITTIKRGEKVRHGGMFALVKDHLVADMLETSHLR